MDFEFSISDFSALVQGWTGSVSGQAKIGLGQGQS